MVNKETKGQENDRTKEQIKEAVRGAFVTCFESIRKTHSGLKEQVKIRILPCSGLILTGVGAAGVATSGDFVSKLASFIVELAGMLMVYNGVDYGRKKINLDYTELERMTGLDEKEIEQLIISASNRVDAKVNFTKKVNPEEENIAHIGL